MKLWLLFQAVHGGKLMAFDFGPQGNMKHYNQVRLNQDQCYFVIFELDRLIVDQLSLLLR